MRGRPVVPFFALVFFLGVAACAPAPTPAVEPPPATLVDTPEAATVSPESPAATAVVSADATPVSTATRVPAMEIGASFRYFDGSLLVAVPEGPFIMGNGAADAPVRTFSLSGFWIYSIEVTNRMYAACVDLGECAPPDATDNPSFVDVREGNRPVVGVDWGQAAAYCEFAHARLPTEAEWEKTARGPDANMYAWGEEPPDCSLLNFDGCVRRTVFVGNYPDGASFYKAMDMSGNVFEWTADWYSASYYGAAPTQDPTGAETGSKRSIRSSAFNTDGFLTEPARRFSANPQDHRADLGFRCVVEDPGYFAPFCTQLLAYGSNAQGGAGSGESVNEVCNQPSIDQKQLDCKSTNVWVDGSGGDISGTVGLDTCIDGGEQQLNGKSMHLYTCGGPPRIINACGKCEYPLPSSSASCADGYHQDGAQCVVGQGAPGQCPEGSTYDPSLMCCSITTGLGNTYNLCPPGYSYVPGDPGSCVDYVAGGIKCDPQILSFKEGCGDNQPDCETNPDDPACLPGGCDPRTDPKCVPDDGGDGPCPDGGVLICDTELNCRCQ